MGRRLHVVTGLPMQMTLEAEPKLKVGDVLKKVTTIATLPQVTMQIIKTVEDPRSTAQSLNKIVSHDPALVTRILKVVNSAFYGLPGQIGSVERAIVVMGLNGIKNIAVAASLGQLFRGATLCTGVSAKDLWIHCIAVAVASRDLARAMRLPLQDEAFLAGMIHDVGILVSLQLFPEQFRQACEESRATGSDFCKTERKIIGLDHQQLGMGLAEQWKFPRGCQLVAGYHHMPGELDDPLQQFVGVIYAADILCCKSKHGSTLTAANQTLTEEQMTQLQLSPEAVAQTAARLDQLVPEAIAVLG
jgi:HD-like signal output (HDOD) protein